MNTFRTVLLALVGTMVQGQLVSYGNAYGPAYSQGIVYASPAAAVAAVRNSYVVAAAPAVATVASNPIVTRAVAVQAAPAVSVRAAPIGPVGAAPAPLAQAVVAGPGGRVRTHEVHTGQSRQAIRIEDFQTGDQVIRVHEAPQAAPQIAQVRVPGEQHHVRVINHQSGPAHVERVINRQATQVFNVQKPGRPGARIVQVIKEQSPPPSIEFVNVGGSNHHVYNANDAHLNGAGIPVVAAPVAAQFAAPVAAQFAAPVAAQFAAPVAAQFAAPVAAHVAAPVAAHVAAPVAVQASPVFVKTIHPSTIALQAAPVAIQRLEPAPLIVQRLQAAPVSAVQGLQSSAIAVDRLQASPVLVQRLHANPIGIQSAHFSGVPYKSAFGY